MRKTVLRLLLIVGVIELVLAFLALACWTTCALSPGGMFACVTCVVVSWCVCACGVLWSALLIVLVLHAVWMDCTCARRLRNRDVEGQHLQREGTTTRSGERGEEREDR